MPPKRKRAGADTTTEGSTTRSTKKSSRTTREKNGATDVTGKVGASNSIEPPSKKTRTTGKKGVDQSPRGRKVAPQVFGIDDEPLNSTTSQQHSDDELDTPKQAPSVAPTRAEYTQRAQALFKSFADDDDPDVIGPGGVERLCTEAGIPLEGAQPLILAWQFKAQEMAKLSRSEWLLGTEALRISSLAVLAVALKEFDDLVINDKEPITPVSSLSSVKRRDAADFQEPYNRTRYWQCASNRNTAFAELYQFCFTLSKPPQCRNLDIETAMALWSVLLAPRYPIVTELIEFLSESGSYKGANKDIWNMVHEFCQTINRELHNYEADGAWPTMLDDFVAWKRDRMARSTDDTPQ
ncbi:Cullin binding-domain-containing protein [Boletus coccyginus]|nr:Cullin binding-domain-containing protein [Boletus coccyginus]